MRIEWTSKASSDLVRLHEHLRPVARDAAARVVQLRYEIAAGTVCILRLWHSRENRSYEYDARTAPGSPRMRGGAHASGQG